MPIHVAMTHALPLTLHAVAITAMFAFGVWLCGRTSRALGEHDHGAIVWDEIVGFLVAAYALPGGWPWLLAAFVSFRALDIAKPWPIGPLDRRIHGGLGVMTDDAIAGVLAFAAIQGAWRLVS